MQLTRFFVKSQKKSTNLCKLLFDKSILSSDCNTLIVLGSETI
jgi:hypothetical protein